MKKTKFKSNLTTYTAVGHITFHTLIFHIIQLTLQCFIFHTIQIILQCFIYHTHTAKSTMFNLPHNTVNSAMFYLSHNSAKSMMFHLPHNTPKCRMFHLPHNTVNSTSDSVNSCRTTMMDGSINTQCKWNKFSFSTDFLVYLKHQIALVVEVPWCQHQPIRVS